MPPVVVAFPDCFTRLGGNQYINSASMGAWEDFCCMRCYRQSSSVSDVAVPGDAACSARAPADMACVAPLRHLVGRGLSFRRYGLRVVLSARHAGCPARARRRRELDRALVAAA